jgi:predicted RNase H-like HicB family nuclease
MLVADDDMAEMIQQQSSKKQVRHLLPDSRKCRKLRNMRNEFTAVFEQDGEWTIAYCPEIPGANGQGHSRDEARQNLANAIALILEDRREDSLRGLPPDAEKDTVVVAA